MKLVSMKQKPRRTLRNTAADVPMDRPVYPWGLELTLENESIKKLDIDIQNTSAGDMVHLVCKAKVTSVSQRQREDTKTGKSETNDSLSLQVTDMYWGKPQSE